MINLSSLYWASEETKDPRFRHIAIMHADTAIKHFILQDGSMRHIVEFDPETGDFVKEYGGQGYALGSAWTRGLAWAIYGFMISYIHTHTKRFLAAAQKVSLYFISHIPENGIISVDFCLPAEPAYCDDTAAAIAACGLIEISQYSDVSDQNMYLQHAKEFFMRCIRSTVISALTTTASHKKGLARIIPVSASTTYPMEIASLSKRC